MSRLSHRYRQLRLQTARRHFRGGQESYDSGCHAHLPSRNGKFNDLIISQYNSNQIVAGLLRYRTTGGLR